MMQTSPTPEQKDFLVKEESPHPWCVFLTGFGQFLVWTAPAAQWLRCTHRIVGHTSFSVGLQSTHRLGTCASAKNGQLPVRLSLEECAVLLSRGLIRGLVLDHPVRRVGSPTMEQLSQFEDALEANAREMKLLSERKRRLELTGLYGRLLHGVPVRARRQMAKQQGTEEEQTTKLSIRARRRATRQLAKRDQAVAAAAVALTTVGDVTDSDNDDCNDVYTETAISTRLNAVVAECVGVETPTVEHLLDYFNTPSSQTATMDEDVGTDVVARSRAMNYEDLSSRHLPRPTPSTWVREGEQERLELPDFTRKGGLDAVIKWLLDQLKQTNLSERSQPTERRHTLLSLVFADLWSLGYHLTPCCTKMGGDFLLYQGDPLLYHATHIVLVSDTTDPIRPDRLAARLRCSHSLCKRLVLATPILRETASTSMHENSTAVVQYTSLQWTRPYYRPPDQRHSTNSMVDVEELFDYDDDDFPSQYMEQSLTMQWSDLIPTLWHEFLACNQSVLEQIWGQIFIIVLFCALCRVLRAIGSVVLKQKQVVGIPMIVVFNQITCVISGLLLLWLYQPDSIAMVTLFLVAVNLILTVQLSSQGTNPGRTVLPLVFLCLAVQTYCEFQMDPTCWHRVRGTMMILIMKVISFAIDLHQLDTADVSADRPPTSIVPRMLALLAYSLCPATLLFGPWISYGRFNQMMNDSFARIVHRGKSEKHTKDNDKLHLHENQTGSCWRMFQSCHHAVQCLMGALVCLSWSTCVAHIIFPDWGDYSWLNAYVASQSFRFSHYFVSYMSEAFLVVFGFGYLANALSSSPPAYGESIRRTPSSEPIEVTHWKAMEFPRSLVDVVVNWNLPMHTWLKQYVYKPVRPYGHPWAILATYSASSLLHGMNFQLSAVLFSIGLFAYLEFILRDRLAHIVNACLGSRPCPSNCGHRFQTNFWVELCNFGFSCLSVFQLAYLAVMFDTSDQQLQGYSMRHALVKWSNLGFLGHYVAFGLFIVYLVIK